MWGLGFTHDDGGGGLGDDKSGLGFRIWVLGLRFGFRICVWVWDSGLSAESPTDAWIAEMHSCAFAALMRILASAMDAANMSYSQNS